MSVRVRCSSRPTCLFPDIYFTQDSVLYNSSGHSNRSETSLFGWCPIPSSTIHTSSRISQWGLTFICASTVLLAPRSTCYLTMIVHSLFLKLIYSSISQVLNVTQYSLVDILILIILTILDDTFVTCRSIIYMIKIKVFIENFQAEPTEDTVSEETDPKE